MKLPPPVLTQRRSAWEIQRAVIFALVVRELRTRVGGRWLGTVWLIAEPLAHVLLMLTIFTYLRNVSAKHTDFPVFLVTGLLPFFMFRNISLRLADAVASNRGLFNYRQVKPIDTLVARALVEVGLYSAVYLSALVLLAWWGLPALPHEPLELAAVSAELITLGFSIGLVLAVLCHNRPWIRSIVGLLFVPLYLMSGVIFSLASVPAELRAWLLLNPVAHLVDLSRAHFIYGYQALEGVSALYPALCALVFAALGMSMYRVERHRLIARD